MQEKQSQYDPEQNKRTFTPPPVVQIVPKTDTGSIKPSTGPRPSGQIFKLKIRKEKLQGGTAL